MNSKGYRSVMHKEHTCECGICKGCIISAINKKIQMRIRQDRISHYADIWTVFNLEQKGVMISKYSSVINENDLTELHQIENNGKGKRKNESVSTALRKIRTAAG